MTISAPTVTRTWTCILFDLDGTIADSAPGITKNIASTLEVMGRSVPSPADLIEYVGPPIFDSFRDFAGMDDAAANEAMKIYREKYREDGAFDSAVFPGIRGLLKRLHDAGIPLAVSTSKPETQAKRILEHFRLDQYFDVICGATEDMTRSTKAQVVAEALSRLSEGGVDLTQTVLVGDRRHDVEGGAENGLPTILVEWGYGSPAEATGAIAVVHSTDQLGSLLLG
jgi:phosphoglycolate phosphatase